MKPLSRNRHRMTVLALPILAAAALAACGGDGGSAVTSGPHVPITVSTPADLGTSEPGATTQLAATVNNDPANLGVTWTVSCPTACGPQKFNAGL